MSSWWGKSSSKHAKRKQNKAGIIGTIKRKLHKSRGLRRHHSDTISEKGPIPLVPSRSSSPSRLVSRCRSFGDWPLPQPLPLPLPGTHLPSTDHANSSTSAQPKLESAKGLNLKSSSHSPLPKPGSVSNTGKRTDAKGDIVTASISSGCYSGNDEQCDSHSLSPLACDREHGNQAIVHSTVRSEVRRNHSPIDIQENSRVSSKLAPQLSNHQLLINTPKGAHLHKPNPNIASSSGLRSAPDSSKSSPLISPIKRVGSEKILNSGFYTGKLFPDIASKHCSNPATVQNSRQSKCSLECSPIPSPGLSSRILSGAVTPLPQCVRGVALESASRRSDSVKQRTYKLPLPPVAIPNNCQLSPTTTPSAPCSPAIAENLTSHASRWKKGQFLGRGTFGHVYLGFDSESGEMCAMKEVTLFSDDSKSMESAKQLAREIELLSGLQHPNIVQYYGSETVDEKIYIYLEYVSGGSIYKLLQQYGQLGEMAIRNYTRQILLGLAYLHAKNTVHRDIKAANILVDPSGRVKLADFGMAKHISGQPSPLSLKGSPFWMAPELIKNSSDCNLAVDIWSLGCTVLEMATTKPPWSEYEGVAAMFKIGFGKDLPIMPNNLSEDGKDFVRLCLQRDQYLRPCASQFLSHPFVKKVKVERPIMFADPSYAKPTLVNVMKSLTIGPAKHNLGLVSEGAGAYVFGNSRVASGSSAPTPKNISHPVSPMGNPLLTIRPLHGSERLSPSPINSPHTTSSSSTSSIIGGIGAVPFHYQGISVIQNSENGRFFNGNTSKFHDGKSHLTDHV